MTAMQSSDWMGLMRKAEARQRDLEMLDRTKHLACVPLCISTYAHAYIPSRAYMRISKISLQAHQWTPQSNLESRLAECLGAIRSGYNESFRFQCKF